jgi:prepilin-type N-terminal cleavage/methylation domain-containing protein
VSSLKKHLILIQYRSKRQNATDGFTLVEVLVAVLLTLIFTAVAMQAMVMATAIKVRGDETSEATNWIQQDLETVKSSADALDYTSGSYVTTSTLCTGGTTGGYANRLQAQSSIGASTTTPQTSALGGRSYNLVRTTNVKTANTLAVNYNVYRASDTAGTSSIATFYSEVIPGASFSCRQ